MQDKITEFIKNNWNSCIRYEPEDKDTLIGMPYPYIVPSPQESLQEMYYWDTFFTCKGLILTERGEIAKNCTDNMLYMVERFGFMPNGNRTYYLSQSQPPYLSMMVMDVYRLYNDLQWLSKAYNILKKEYEFWMTKRITPVGLNQFGINEDYIGDVDKHYYSICKRIDYLFPSDDHFDFAKNALSDCESGWDFNPRAAMNQSKYIYVDLNSNLYIYEKNFEYFSNILNNGESQKWNEVAMKRLKLMNKYLWNGKAFMDYNFVENEFSPVFSVASFYPLWANIATEEQAKSTVEMLDKLEFEYGISTCAENNVPGSYQWDYPNGWAPLQYIMICALDRYGYQTEAIRVAEKYIRAMERMFERTGCLWEKYNVLTGDNDTVSDYQSRVMIGWTAGVYIFAKQYLKKALK